MDNAILQRKPTAFFITQLQSNIDLFSELLWFRGEERMCYMAAVANKFGLPTVEGRRVTPDYVQSLVEQYKAANAAEGPEAKRGRDVG